MIRKNILKHIPTDKSFPDIHPAKLSVPQWYKDTPRFPDNKQPTRFPIESTYKICPVYGEAFTSGYMLPLPVDIAIEKSNDGPIISWSSANEAFVMMRDSKNNSNLPVPAGHYSQHFVWQTKHFIEIPKGYSFLITHPLNRHDLPFTTLSGIVDGNFVMHGGNIPVFFNKDFEGIIPAGTPIAQILPFKNEAWSSIVDSAIIETGMINNNKSLNAAFGWYKQNIWKKKQYD